MTLIEPGGACTEFRFGGAQLAERMPEYDETAARAPLHILDPANGLAPGDPARMAAAIIASVDREPAPMRVMLGSEALRNSLSVLRVRIAGFEAQTDVAASTDFRDGSRRH